MSAFGPTLLSKVLGLNDTQESSLGLVFHYADQAGLPLLDLADLREVVKFLTSDEGKADLKNLGGLSAATAGVILRELIGFSDQGADAFFGEPEFESSDFLQTTADGKGLISLVELPNLQDRPQVFSTFLMWLLADLFHDLPEVGDVDKPKLVFFFDEAHLLFNDASKAFLDQIAQTVRLIRSKGVGVFFVTQSPTDVPDAVLAQLGSRVQHQLRAHTPNDAKALKATVNTYPNSAYDDLGEVITGLGIGEAIVTVMNERGAPTPVAWTRLRAPESLMAPTDPAAMQATVAASPRNAKYATAVDRESAREMLAAKLEKGAEKAAAEKAAEEKAKADAKTAKKSGSSSRRSTKEEEGVVTQVVKSGAFRQFMRTAASEIARGLFGTGRVAADYVRQAWSAAAVAERSAVARVGDGDGAVAGTPLHPPLVEERVEHRGAEPAGQVVALLAPVEADAQQWPLPAPTAYGLEVDPELAQHRVGVRAELVGMFVQLRRQRVVAAAPGVGDPVAGDQDPAVEQPLGDRAAVAAGQVVVAGPGPAQRGRAGAFAQRPDRQRRRQR